MNPDCIVSVNTIEHLASDKQFFDSVLEYANTKSLDPTAFTLIIACPMMHKLHALPHDYRRYTYHGLMEQINSRIDNSRLNFVILPVGGSIFVLLEALMVQYSYTMSILTTPVLKFWRFFDNIFYRLKYRGQRKGREDCYPLGYVIYLSNTKDLVSQGLGQPFTGS